MDPVENKPTDNHSLPYKVKGEALQQNVKLMKGFFHNLCECDGVSLTRIRVVS